MLKLLIAESAAEFRNALADMLDGEFEVQTCCNGNEVLPILQSFQPELMVLDMMLPGMDGISLLETAGRENRMPIVLATTSFSSDYVVHMLEKIGVSYLMIKPCDLGAMVARLRDLATRISSRTDRPESAATDILFSLGLSSKHRGYTYLQHSIAELARRPGQMVTKEIYPAVAKRYGASAAQVERSIRSAIASAWDNRDEGRWRQYFCGDREGALERPTNAEFISCIAEHLTTRMNRG